MLLCGCPACQKAVNVYNIKKLYSVKEQDPEANYYSRQLIGLHAVQQHRNLCEVISRYESISKFADKYKNAFTLGLEYIYKNL